MQPYNSGSNFRNNPLWQLHELNRIDKHRHLTICASSPTKDGENYASFVVIKPGGLGQIASLNVHRINELKENSISANYTLFGGNSEINDNFKPSSQIEIAFGQGSGFPSQIVIPFVERILDFIQDGVLNPLSRYITS